MPLTDVQVRTAKGREKPYKLSDGGWLYLYVTPSESKLWRMAYRYAEKEKVLTLGAYPEVSLKDARAARDEAKALLTKGIDPNQKKQLDKLTKAATDAVTFKSVSEELLAKVKREGKADITISKKRWLLDMAYPAIGERPISEITAPEILAVLQKVESAGIYETAKRLRATIGQVFRFGVATGRALHDPTFALRGALTAPKVTHRAAITDAKRFGELLRSIDSYETWNPATRTGLFLLAILFPRPGELRMAEWREIDFEKALWTIPAARMKMRREHKAPLPRQAIEHLKALQPLTGGGRYVFPAVGNHHRPMSENTLNAALRRLGYGQNEMTSHGFRATASTLLNESGKFSADAIERALAHQEADAVRRAYARGEHWKERAGMMNWWADHLDMLRKGGEVVPMKRKP